MRHILLQNHLPTKFRIQSHKTSKLSSQNQIQTSQRRDRASECGSLSVFGRRHLANSALLFGETHFLPFFVARFFLGFWPILVFFLVSILLRKFWCQQFCSSSIWEILLCFLASNILNIISKHQRSVCLPFFTATFKLVDF